MRVALADLRYDQRNRPLHDATSTASAALGRGGLAADLRPGATSWSRSPVPARPIARGETIGAEDVDLVAGRLAASLPSDALRRPEDLVGQQAARAAGRPAAPARAGDLVAPWLVRRGDDASMRLPPRRPRRSWAPAMALDQGRQGESVRVRNAGSGEVRRAVVVGPRQVEVDDPGAVP